MKNAIQAGPQIQGKMDRSRKPGLAIVHRSQSSSFDSAILARQSSENQKTLTAFLDADLDLSFTMLKLVKMARSVEFARSGIDRIRQALRIVRRFACRIEDAASQERIYRRAESLQRRLDLLNF